MLRNSGHVPQKNIDKFPGFFFHLCLSMAEEGAPGSNITRGINRISDVEYKVLRLLRTSNPLKGSKGVSRSDRTNGILRVVPCSWSISPQPLV